MSRFWAAGGNALVLSRSFRLDTSGAGSGTLISAPTYALHTASGVSPASWDVGGDSTFQPGMYVHQQFAADSGFTTSLVDYYTQVEGSDWEANSDTIGNGLVTFVQPTGTYYTRCRFETSPGDTTNNVVSGWSSTVTDTINASTAVLSSATTDKYSGIVLDTSWQAHTTSDQNGQMSVRTNVAQSNQKGHFEVHIDALDALAGDNGSIACGICDSGSVTSFNASFPNPGHGSAPGFTVMVKQGSTTLTKYINSGGTGDGSYTLTSAPAVGDVISFDHDYTAHTVHVRYHHASGGAPDEVGTFTLTTLIPANPYLFVAFYRVNNKVTLNPGNTTFVVTPDTGYTYAC